MAAEPIPLPFGKTSKDDRGEGRKRTIVFSVTMDTLRQDYFVDCSRWVHQETAEPALSEKLDDTDEEVITTGTKKRKKGRREDKEDYDLEDPFIDDGELPPGFSLIDMLTGAAEAAEADSEEEGEDQRGVVVKKSEYYVWKGRLPERESDPLWAEKVQARLRKQRTNAKQRRKGALKRKREEEEEQGRGQVSPKKQVKTLKLVKESAKTPREKKRPKKPKDDAPSHSASISDRIAMLGEADEDQPQPREPMDASRMDIVEKRTENADHCRGEKMAPLETCEEKMRKRIESTRPFLELEHRLAMAAFRAEVEKTVFADPKKFPSNLRSPINEAIASGMRLMEKKTSLPPGLLESFSALLPFPAGSLEKLLLGKVVPLYRDELRLKGISELMEALRTEVASLAESGEGGESGKRRPKWTERIRELISDLIRHELDWQSLDRLASAYAELKVESFSEITIRKGLYPRIAACWPAGEMTTTELGKEYSMWRRKMELRKLKEHGIQVTPTLIPIQSKTRLVENRIEAVVVNVEPALMPMGPGHDVAEAAVDPNPDESLSAVVL